MRPLLRLASMGLAVLAVVCARTVTATPRDAVIHAARCRVRCLSLLSSKRPRIDMVSAFTGIKMSRWPTFAQCIDDSNCTACLRPCSQPFVNLNLCQSVCESDTESCQQSCSYLKEISTTWPGRCPADNKATATGTVTPCTANCRIDLDCRHQGKCCQASCGKMCRRPTHRFEGVPPVPKAPHIRERPKGGILEVKWTGASSNFTLPVVYIIESRWTVGAQHSEMPFTHWQQISQTTTNSAIVHDATPGHWYQFRVSAVSMNGCMGPSTQTEPFRLSREPRPPGSPRNLTEGDTIITNRQMSVTIHWRPPRKNDLPISKYKLFWSAQMKDELSSQILSGPLQEHRKVLKGNVLKYELPDLLPDTTYFIQVQAICKYGDSKLKSSRSNMYIQTAQPWHDELEPTPMVVVRPLPPPAPLRDLMVHNPYFQNGLLKTNVTWKRPLALHTGEAPVDHVVVQWKPHACISGGLPDKDGRSTTLGPNTLTATMSATTRDSFYIIYDLRFDCQLYMVRVWPVSVDAVRGAQANVTFPMTDCKEIKVLGDISPDCPTSVPQVPAKPPHLEHSVVNNGANMSVRLSWHTPHSDIPITDYRVEWGKLVEGEGKPLPENTLTKVLPKEVHSFSIGSMVGGTEYLVRVQALIITAPKKVISGRVATLHFSTPILTARHIDPPYQHSNVKVALQPDAIKTPSMHSVRSSGSDTSGASKLHVKHTLISLISLAMTNILFCCHYVNARTL